MRNKVSLKNYNDYLLNTITRLMFRAKPNPFAQSESETGAKLVSPDTRISKMSEIAQSPKLKLKGEIYPKSYDQFPTNSNFS